MHMMSKNSVISVKTKEYSIWSFYVALVSAFVLDDVFSGGWAKESFNLHKLEYALSVFFMIATTQVLASDGSKGVCFNQAYSLQAL